jgi:hypothetical protein
MSYNRLIYDNCAYATQIKESTSPLAYNLYKGKYENCIDCPVGDFTTVLPFKERAYVENELHGLNRLGSLCPSIKYDPKKEFKHLGFSPPVLCSSIYYITPNNLQRPVTRMYNDDNLGKTFCNK